MSGFKVLCDVHIAFKVQRLFQGHGYEAVHVNSILEGSRTKDGDISDYANSHGFTVLTKDLDFKNSHFLRNKPEKLTRIALGNLPTSRLIEILEKNMGTLASHFKGGKCFVEIGDAYMRVLK